MSHLKSLVSCSPTLNVLARLADASEYLTSFVKLVIWLGLAVLVWNLVSYALFPEEYLFIPG